LYRKRTWCVRCLETIITQKKLYHNKFDYTKNLHCKLKYNYKTNCKCLISDKEGVNNSGAPLAIFSFLLNLKPRAFGPVLEAKFEKLSDLHSFAVEEVVSLLKKITFFPSCQVFPK
jgi:hypothetical protein